MRGVAPPHDTDRTQLTRRLGEVNGMLTVLGLNADAAAWRAAGPDRRLTGVVGGLVAELLEQRQLARARRDFAAADAIRDTLAGLGVEVSDTPNGTRWSLLAGSRH